MFKDKKEDEISVERLIQVVANRILILSTVIFFISFVVLSLVFFFFPKWDLAIIFGGFILITSTILAVGSYIIGLFLSDEIVKLDFKSYAFFVNSEFSVINDEKQLEYRLHYLEHKLNGDKVYLNRSTTWQLISIQNMEYEVFFQPVSLWDESPSYIWNNLLYSFY